MVDIVQTHFSKIKEPTISYDGQYFSVLGEKDNEILPVSFETLMPSELNVGHHINYFTFRKCFELMRSFENPIILETGSSAHGTNSSVLFDTYVQKYGGSFFTVDINNETTKNVKKQLKSSNSHATNMDSVTYIQSFPFHVDVAYLDSYDMEWLDPKASAEHGKNEIETLLSKINKKAIILIDDTPEKAFFLPFRNDIHKKLLESCTMPGKGMYAEQILQSHPEFRYQKILHMYAILLVVERL